MISARNISLVANGKKILNGVNLDIASGSFVAVAGPNGAGKTSLLKVLSRDTNQFAGKVDINGRDMRKYSVADLSRVRSVLPQDSSVQFPFTVRQIVEMSRQHHRTLKSKNEMLFREVMELTGIVDLQERNYLTLSGGEQQRVQLARVLAQVWEITSYPRYILLDEPTSSLDIAQQQLMFSLVKHGCKRNIGIFAIVHDLNQVVQFADHLYFLKEGGIVAHGRPRDIFKKHIIEETFCCRVNVYHDPCTDCPYIVPDKNEFQEPLKAVNL